MAGKAQVLDRWGRPVQRTKLLEEIAAPTIGGVRSPAAGYPADSLNPLRLTAILRAADQGDPVRYMELAEAIEDRDPHYVGVLGTRKRSVSQLDIWVKPGGKSPLAKEMAERVETWVEREELSDELVEILDAVGKSYSFTEIMWDRSTGQWDPKQLVRRDQRWFRFDRRDLTTPTMLDDRGQEQPLDAFKFIYARMSSKSGLPLKSGLARVASWIWLFKALAQRDWSIFTQTYGQPLRLGRYPAGSSQEDRDKLFRAVANIAGDMAAIVPEGMDIEFTSAPNLAAAADIYESRCDWLDKQTSKLVIGQTATTDAETGGLGSGKEHRQVQEDIERADAKQLTAIINRDLIHPWMQLEFETQDELPRVIIGREEEEDLAALSTAIAPFLALGYRPKPEMIEKFGLIAPQTPPNPNPASHVGPGNASESEFEYPLNTLKGNSGAVTAHQAQTHSVGRFAREVPEEILADELDQAASPMVEAMLVQIASMLDAARDLEEFREMIRTGFPDLRAEQLAALFSQAMQAAETGGRVVVESEADG